MKRELKPNAWSCLPTAFAMAMDLAPQTIIEGIGHDGSEIIHPELPDPASRRGFHPQECIDVADWLGYTATPFEYIPQLQTVKGRVIPIWWGAGENWRRIHSIVHNSMGVILGHTTKGYGHACAYERGVVFCPDRGLFPFEQLACDYNQFQPNTIYKVKRQ